MEGKNTYIIKVSHSEPQIVDTKKVFYTPCLVVNSPRVEASPSRKFFKKKTHLECILTEKIKRRESFENVYKVLTKARMGQIAEG